MIEFIFRNVRMPRAGSQLGLIAALVLLGCGPGPSQNEFTFSFAPPDGTKVVQSLIVTRSQDITGQAPLEEQTKSTTQLVFAAKGDGYEVSQETTEIEISRKDKPVEDPVAKLMQSMAIIYEVDSQGQVTKVRGYENIAERLSELPASLARVLMRVFTEETLIAQATDDWQRRYGDYSGKSIKIGDVWQHPRVTGIPGGRSLTTYTVTWFPGSEPCGERQCVTVRVLYDSNLENLRAEMKTVLPDLEVFSDVPAENGNTLSVSGSISRLVDPATLLPVEESQIRITQTSSGETDILVTQNKLYSFEYQ